MVLDPLKNLKIRHCQESYLRQKQKFYTSLGLLRWSMMFLILIFLHLQYITLFWKLKCLEVGPNRFPPSCLSVPISQFLTRLPHSVMQLCAFGREMQSG